MPNQFPKESYKTFENQPEDTIKKNDFPPSGWTILSYNSEPKLPGEGVKSFELFPQDGYGEDGATRDILYYDPEKIEIIEIDDTGKSVPELKEYHKEMKKQGWEMLQSGYLDSNKTKKGDPCVSRFLRRKGEDSKD